MISLLTMKISTFLTKKKIKVLFYNNYMTDYMLINKPEGWTSFDVVAKVRSVLSKAKGEKVKVGHAGTLDPFATGLLIILVGDATKNQDKFMKLDKEYEATIKVGFNSTTGDPEGQIEAISDRQPEISEIKKALEKFTGEIKQTPPKYSAVKIRGKRAYELARAGKEFELKARKVTIHKIEVLKYDYPYLKVKISCSSGTYVRTLAEDIGKNLGTGAYLTKLHRTKIGNFDIEDAIKIEDIISDM